MKHLDQRHRRHLGLAMDHHHQEARIGIMTKALLAYITSLHPPEAFTIPRGLSKAFRNQVLDVAHNQRREQRPLPLPLLDHPHAMQWRPTSSPFTKNHPPIPLSNLAYMSHCRSLSAILQLLGTNANTTPHYHTLSQPLTILHTPLGHCPSL